MHRMCNVFFLSFFFCTSFLFSFYLFLSLLHNAVAASDYSTDDRMNDTEGAEKNHKQSSFKILHSFLYPCNYLHILTMTAEASCNVHVHVIGVRTNNSILIIGVVFIVATPTISHL